MTEFLEVLALGVLTGAVYGLFSAGLSLAFGVLRIANFAHGDFVMLGMYLAYYIHIELHVSIYAAIPFGAVGGVVVGIPTYLLVFKGARARQDHSQLILALALSLLIETVALNAFGYQTQSLNALTLSSWHVGPFYFPIPQVWAALCAVLATIGLEILLTYSRQGRTIRAVVADREVAEVLGNRSGATFVFAFALSISLAVIAGVVLFGYYPATNTVGQNFALIGFICVVLGGIGDVRGAFIAGIVVGISESMLATYWNTSVQDVAAYVIFIFGVTVFPRGILGRAVIDA